MSLNADEGGAQDGFKFARTRKPGEGGKPGEGLIARGENVGLLVGDHLQAMLDHAQKAVVAVELPRGTFGDPTGIRQRIEHVERLAAAQRGVAAAGDELLGLNEEFYLADAAAAELDVVTPHRHLAMALDGMDLALQRLHIGNGGEVEIFAPDVRLETVEEFLAQRKIARQGTRLDHGGALPVLAHALVVDGGSLESDGALGGARVRAQPKVDAVQIALSRRLLQDVHEIRRQADVE